MAVKGLGQSSGSRGGCPMLGKSSLTERSKSGIGRHLWQRCSSLRLGPYHDIADIASSLAGLSNFSGSSVASGIVAQ